MEAVMRLTTPAVAIVAALLAAPVLAGAQEPVTSFDQLNSRLKVGDTAWVTDAQGREIKGKIRDIQPSSLVIEADGMKTFQASDVRQLVERGTCSRTSCLLWGLAGGTGAGIVAAFATRGPMSSTWCLATAPEGVYCASTRMGLGDEAYLLIPAGAGVGLAVGAIFASRAVGPKRVIYRAPGASGSARLSVAPVITSRTKGVAVGFSF
jgi:hypothetical protein